jgi:hypothetical protein
MLRNTIVHVSPEQMPLVVAVVGDEDLEQGDRHSDQHRI